MHSLLRYTQMMVAYHRHTWRLRRAVGFNRTRHVSGESPEHIATLEPARPLRNDECRLPRHVRSYGLIRDTWPELSVARRFDVLAHPNGVLTDGLGRIFSETIMWGDRPWVWRIRRSGLARIDADGPTVQKAFWIGACHQGNYYHWFIEAVSRLALARDWLRRECLPIAVAASAGFQADSLARLFPELTILPWPAHGPLRIRECYYVPPVEVSGVPDPRLVAALRAVVASQPIKRQPRRAVWIERTGAQRSLTTATPGFAARLDQFGYERIAPENLSFAEQQDLFAGTRVLAGAHGAGLTNLLWMEPGTRVVELATALYGFACYPLMADMAGIEHSVVMIDTRWRALASCDYGCYLPLRLSRVDEDRLFKTLAEAAVS